MAASLKSERFPTSAPGCLGAAAFAGPGMLKVRGWQLSGPQALPHLGSIGPGGEWLR